MPASLIPPEQRQTQKAYQAYLANAGAAMSKEELEKAKQRKLPKF
jgi:hypothetical protein